MDVCAGCSSSLPNQNQTSPGSQRTPTTKEEEKTKPRICALQEAGRGRWEEPDGWQAACEEDTDGGQPREQGENEVTVYCVLRTLLLHIVWADICSSPEITSIWDWTPTSSVVLLLACSNLGGMKTPEGRETCVLSPSRPTTYIVTVDW